MVKKVNKKSNPKYTGIKEISDRLKIARKNAGYTTRKEFAIQNKIPHTTYQKHESGERNIFPTSIIKYCKILNRSIIWLLTGEKAYENNEFEIPEKLQVDAESEDKDYIT